MKEKITQDISYKVIGCAMNVSSFLGNGFQEVIYQRALAWELSQENIGFVREQSLDIFYKDCSEPIGTRRVDFLIEEELIVEIKAIMEIDNSHYAQILNYLKVYKVRYGLLLNFGNPKLFYKRFIL